MQELSKLVDTCVEFTLKYKVNKCKLIKLALFYIYGLLQFSVIRFSAIIMLYYKNIEKYNMLLNINILYD